MIKGDKEKIIEYMDRNPNRLFKAKLVPQKRTLSQNGYFHVLFNMIAFKIGMDEELVKRNMLKACFGVEKIEIRTHNEIYYFEEAKIPSTKLLTVQQGIEFIEMLIQFAKSLGIDIDKSDEKRFIEYYNEYIF